MACLNENANEIIPKLGQSFTHVSCSCKHAGIHRGSNVTKSTNGFLLNITSHIM
jgi:hypothetical protein